MRRDSYDNSQYFISVSASPGFTFGRSGTVTNGSWLLVDGNVPSNVAGRAIYLYNATIEVVFFRAENATSCDLEIYEHDGTTYTLVHTTNIVASRSTDDIVVSPVPITKGKELAIQIVNGSAKNAVVGLQIKGSLEP